MDEGHLHITENDGVSTFVGHEMRCRHSRGSLHPLLLVAIDVDRHIGDLEKSRDPLDAISHHRSTDVIGVVVGGQHSGHGHVIGGSECHQVVDRVGRIDHDASTTSTVADEIDEIGHLTGEGITGGEVDAGLELAEVERIAHGIRLTTLRDGCDYAVVVSQIRPPTGRLVALEAGQKIPFGGSRWAEVTPELAAAFAPGDHLVVVQDSGDLLHVPQAVVELTARAVEDARQGFVDLQATSSEAITGFFESFARNLESEEVFGHVVAANDADVESARRRGRATGRLVLDDKMRRSMVEALRLWRDAADVRDEVVERVEHRKGPAWSVDSRRAPLGVVGFVFEGRPNVFADATGVLRSGNAVVFRIGSDALGTARAMMHHAVAPALAESGLPQKCVVLLDSAERSAGYALFSYAGLSLAVARGSGEAVAQLGAVARQSGVPVSLHGTGGAWMLVAPSADGGRVEDCVDASLDRKVCNTLNVCCVPVDRPDLLDAVIAGARRAGERRGVAVRIHAVGSTAVTALARHGSSGDGSGDLIVIPEADDAVLATEWEWDDQPEFSVRMVENWRDGVDLFNRWSPHFIVSVLSADQVDLEEAYRRADAPFVGDGFTRWVDGQYALERPELGLSNWQSGRLFGRGGILSGDGVYSLRYLARHSDSQQRR